MKKTKLDFHRALGSEEARGLYDRLLGVITASIGHRCQAGEFGAYMEVN
jgi:D-Tyr-tRNAtyr deacylase